jgi:hypothetical protein
MCLFFKIENSLRSEFRDVNYFLRRHPRKDTDCVESFIDSQTHFEGKIEIPILQPRITNN